MLDGIFSLLDLIANLASLFADGYIGYLGHNSVPDVETLKRMKDRTI